MNQRVLSANHGNSEHCTTAYVVSKQGAILMFKSLPIAHPIDLIMVWAVNHPDYSVYSVWPSVFRPIWQDRNKASDGTGIRDDTL